MEFFSYFFFGIDQVDEVNTKWGEADSCSFYYYFPIIEITVAVLWIVLILISGRRGERRAKT